MSKGRKQARRGGRVTPKGTRPRAHRDIGAAPLVTRRGLGLDVSGSCGCCDEPPSLDRGPG